MAGTLPSQTNRQAGQRSPTTTFRSKPEISGFRILLDVCRLAERDYLAKRTPKSHRETAMALLFGASSTFESVCSCLGIQPNAARLTLVAWKLAGKVGDPVFGFLNSKDSYNSFVNGKPLTIPTYESTRTILNGDGAGRPAKG